jgi:hypothetical protein
MISGRAPTPWRSDSSAADISKSTPRRSICCASSRVDRPFILTAFIRPCLVMGFFVCVAAAPADRSAAQASANAMSETLPPLEVVCFDMAETSLAGGPAYPWTPP